MLALLTQTLVIGVPGCVAFLAAIHLRHDGPTCQCSKCTAYRARQ